MCVYPYRIRLSMQKNPSLALPISDFFQKTENILVKSLEISNMEQNPKWKFFAKNFL